jgi:hypothetical protein
MSEPMKKFLGFQLEKDPKVDLWFNDGGPGEVSVALNRFEDSWVITITLGQAILRGEGKTERAAREELTRKMKAYSNLLSYFKV